MAMTQAERKRRFLNRQANGRRCYTIEADEIDLAELLVAGGYLSPLVADVHERQRQALEAMVADLDLERVPTRFGKSEQGR